jgi:hypothetical protein
MTCCVCIYIILLCVYVYMYMCVFGIDAYIPQAEHVEFERRWTSPYGLHRLTVICVCALCVCSLVV